jgi:hypothetical protein
VCRTWSSSIKGDVPEFSAGHNKIAKNIIRKTNYKPYVTNYKPYVTNCKPYVTNCKSYVTNLAVDEKTWIKVTKEGDQ